MAEEVQLKSCECYRGKKTLYVKDDFDVNSCILCGRSVHPNGEVTKRDTTESGARIWRIL